MLPLLVAITVFTFLYGFAWHNQPAKERRNTEHEHGENS